MADYVNRADIMAALTSSEMQKKLKSGSGDESYNEVLMLINSAPAVKIVRCQDCKHWRSYPQAIVEGFVTWGDCQLISMDIDMPANGFCCFAER